MLSAAPPTLRSNFMATPFYLARLPVDPIGSASVSVTLPDNIGSFVIRATAVSRVAGNSPEWQYGTGEAELRVRRKVSLQPSTPRSTFLFFHFPSFLIFAFTLISFSRSRRRHFRGRSHRHA